jgi:hypothetical protein
MIKLDNYFNEIDSARVRRVKELSEVKRSFERMIDSDVLGVASKAIVVLAYANWEGFYNECVRTYLRFLVERGGKVRDSNWMLLVSAFHADFERMRDRNHSLDARLTFVNDLRTQLDCGFEAIDAKTVESRSNLDFSRLSENYRLLNFDVSKMQKMRIRLDKELVGWRHAVAHGDSPDLTEMDVTGHIDFTSNLLVLIADQFQFAMLDKA